MDYEYTTVLPFQITPVSYTHLFTVFIMISFVLYHQVNVVCCYSFSKNFTMFLDLHIHASPAMKSVFVMSLIQTISQQLPKYGR